MKLLKEENEIQYFNLSILEIEKIKVLWQKNGKYHAKLSQHFADIFQTLGFEERMNKLSSVDKIYITLAKKEEKEIAYCLSVVEKTGGELLSFFVEENFRGKGIGGVLIKEHLQWLRENASSIQVAVLYENERALRFYQKYGFEVFTSTMLMKGSV